MQTLTTAEVTCERGVDDDSRGRPGKRQVTVLFESSWRDACAELQQELDWTVRRANLLIGDVDFATDVLEVAMAGEDLHIEIGDALLAVTGETEPCGRMEEQRAGLLAAMTPEWRGGFCCRVITGGLIQLGDSVRMVVAGH